MIRSIECSQECAECPILDGLVGDVFFEQEKAGIEQGVAEAYSQAELAARRALRAKLARDGDDEWLEQAITRTGIDLSEAKMQQRKDSAQDKAEIAQRQQSKVEEQLDVIESVRKHCPSGKGVVIEGPRVDIAICLRNPSVPKTQKLQVQSY